MNKQISSIGGYTLVEILIVLFIISIVTTVGLLSIGHNENKQIEAVANEITQMMTLAEEQAMLQPSVLGVSLKNHVLQFSRLQSGDNTKNNKWVMLDNNTLGKQIIPNNIEIGMAVGNANIVDADTTKIETHIPQIIISTNGDITPFTIYLGKIGQKPRYAISGDANGNVTSKLLS